MGEMAESEWRHYEAIVEKRWDYYAPRFARFARGGWLSWNWAAFFGTFAWLSYRRLRRWAWLYFFVSTPALLVLLLVAPAVTDACERALGQESGVYQVVIIALLVLGWVVPPLFADRFYFARVKAWAQAKTQDGAARGGTHGWAGAAFIQVVAFLLPAVALPSYANYKYRARVSEGVSIAANLKVAVAEYLSQNGRIPRLQEIAGTTSGRYVESVDLLPDGTIRARFGAAGERLAGRSVSIVPRIEGRNVAEWTCRSDDLPNQCLPAACRR
jgi:type IV pilus assembly protein PilA